MLEIILNLVVAIFGLVISPYMANLVKLYSNDEKITLKGIFKFEKFDIKIGFITPILLLGLFWKFGISAEFFVYSIIGIILIIDAFVDFKAQIIPNSTNFAMFLFGIVLMYIEMVKDIYQGLDMFYGMLFGAGIFFTIAVLAKIIYRKEGMGLGDVKLMGALGLFFGFFNTVQIFIVSFAIGAIISIILLIFKIKKSDDYIAFGPFIVIASIITMFIPYTVMFPWYLKLLSFSL